MITAGSVRIEIIVVGVNYKKDRELKKEKEGGRLICENC